MKKKVFLFGLLFSLLLLCGCGVNLTSTVKLNKDFSGTRVMSCTFFFPRFFIVISREAKKILINSSKNPARMLLLILHLLLTETIRILSIFVFLLLMIIRRKFVIFLNFSPEITYEYGDSPFVSGLIYKENFTSKDLMTWLYTALYEGKYIDKDSSSDLWDLKSTEISFLGTTYETKDKINIDEMAYVPLSSIHIDTKTKKSGKLARVIEFDLPQQTLDQNAGKIRSYFAGNDITWENTSDGKTLCISFDANNFSDLAQKTRTVLHSKNSFGTYSSTCSKDNPFTLKINYEESLDLSHFIQKNQKIPVTYTFDEKQMFSDSIKQKEISFTSSVTQPISTYEIATVWNTSKDIRRKVSFSFEKAVTDHQLSVIKKQFKGQTIDSVNLDW